jgi:hypothetical protein
MITCASGATSWSSGECLEATLSRHDDIEQDHVGQQRARPAHRLVGCRCISDHRDVRLALEQGGDARPQDSVVVGDEDANHETEKQNVEGASSHMSPPRCRTISRQRASPSPEPPNFVE